MSYSRTARRLFHRECRENHEGNKIASWGRTHMTARYKSFKQLKQTRRPRRHRRRGLLPRLLKGDLMDLYFNNSLVKAIHLAVAYMHGDVDIVQDSHVKKVLRCLFANTAVLKEENLRGAIENTSDNQIFFMRVFQIQYCPKVKNISKHG